VVDDDLLDLEPMVVVEQRGFRVEIVLATREPVNLMRADYLGVLMKLRNDR